MPLPCFTKGVSAGSMPLTLKQNSASGRFAALFAGLPSPVWDNMAPLAPAGISAGDQPLAMVHELPLHSLTLQRQTGHAAPVTALAQHPQQPLAASLDASGLLLLWAVPAGASLQLLGSLSELSGAAQALAGSTAVAWLDPAGGSVQLAVGGAHGVDIYGLSRCACHAHQAT